MRSFADISKILSESKKKCNVHVAGFGFGMSKAARKKEEEFKAAYFITVDEFMRDTSNNFTNALVILILIEKNKDTFLAELLIRQVAFPILYIPYQKYQPSGLPCFINPFHAAAEMQEYARSENKRRQQYNNTNNTHLSTAIKIIDANIRHPDEIKKIFVSCNFFPVVLNNLITEYAVEEIVARYDLLLRSVTFGTALSDEEKQTAEKNGTPILTHKKHTELNIDIYFLYGNSDGNGEWKETKISISHPEEAALLNDLPFDEKIMKADDMRFTDLLRDILKKGHTPTIDYTLTRLLHYRR